MPTARRDCCAPLRRTSPDASGGKRDATVVQTSLPVVNAPLVQGARALRGCCGTFPHPSFPFAAPRTEIQAGSLNTNTALILTSGLVARALRIPHRLHVREFFSEFPRLWRFYQWYMYVLAERNSMHFDSRNGSISSSHSPDKDTSAL